MKINPCIGASILWLIVRIGMLLWSLILAIMVDVNRMYGSILASTYYDDVFRFYIGYIFILGLMLILYKAVSIPQLLIWGICVWAAHVVGAILFLDILTKAPTSNFTDLIMVIVGTCLPDLFATTLLYFFNKQRENKLREYVLYLIFGPFLAFRKRATLQTA
jgi:hypothetical protein